MVGDPKDADDDAVRQTEPDTDVRTDELDAVLDEKSEKPPKFVFECQRTGDCCKRESVHICFNDLQRWVKDDTIFRIIPYLGLALENEEVFLQLAKYEDGYCSLYHHENKACSIHYNKPLYCRSYPLGYNGEKYVLKSKECTGVGKGKMTKEMLKQMRDDAFEEYYGLQQINELLPVLQSIIFNQLTAESKKMMEDLSPEQREKLDEMLKKKNYEPEEK